MTDTTYSGWTNYETWNCKLWIDNDGSLEYWEEQAKTHATIGEDKEDAIQGLAEELQSSFEENAPGDAAGFYANMINAALRAVNWREIAQSIIEDAELLD